MPTIDEALCCTTLFEPLRRTDLDDEGLLAWPVAWPDEHAGQKQKVGGLGRELSRVRVELQAPNDCSHELRLVPDGAAPRADADTASPGDLHGHLVCGMCAVVGSP